MSKFTAKTPTVHPNSFFLGASRKYPVADQAPVLKKTGRVDVSIADMFVPKPSDK